MTWASPPLLQSRSVWPEPFGLVGPEAMSYGVPVVAFRLADNSLARRLLGWEPKVRFMDGLHQTIEWYFSTKDREMVGAALVGRLTER